MGLSVYVHDEPECTEKDYQTRYKKPCLKVEVGFQSWYLGTGVLLKKHPLKKFLSVDRCGECGSEDFLVIAAQHSIHPQTGDEYWDCEIACNECGKYTLFSYAENS